MYLLCVWRAHQTAASKSAVKKEKNMKDKMRTGETGSQGSGDVDDHGKSAVDASKNDKSHVISSEQSELQDILTS